MGDAFIVRRGGMADAYAVISVTYPSGSVCTCTKGTKTLRAKDTSGSYPFLIPESGTWVVSCTKDGKTATKNVVISSQYQAEHVTLVYPLFLFAAGSGFASGYRISNTTHPTVSNANLTFTGTASVEGNARMVISPAVDLTNYSSLNFDLELSYNWGETWGFYIGVGEDDYIQVIYDEDVLSFYSWIEANSYNRGTLSLDVSALNSPWYIKSGFSYCAGKIYNIWLE